MASIFFPDVPEFAPIVRALSVAGDVRARRAGGYVEISSERELHVKRSDTGVGEAVWFGALVGGVEGRIIAFDDRELRIA